MIQKPGRFQMVIVDKTIVVIGRKWRSKWWTIKCCGCSRHKRRKDKTCKHERALMEHVKPELLGRTRIDCANAP
jgi:hypothetical protein